MGERSMYTPIPGAPPSNVPAAQSKQKPDNNRSMYMPVPSGTVSRDSNPEPQGYPPQYTAPQGQCKQRGEGSMYMPLPGQVSGAPSPASTQYSGSSAGTGSTAFSPSSVGSAKSRESSKYCQLRPSDVPGGYTPPVASQPPRRPEVYPEEDEERYAFGNAPQRGGGQPLASRPSPRNFNDGRGAGSTDDDEQYAFQRGGAAAPPIRPVSQPPAPSQTRGAGGQAEVSSYCKLPPQRRPGGAEPGVEESLQKKT